MQTLCSHPLTLKTFKQDKTEGKNYCIVLRAIDLDTKELCGPSYNTV